MSIFSFLRRRIWYIVTVIIVLGIACAIYFLTRPGKPQYLTATATFGDLRQTVEAVGTITSERDLALQFPITDVVSSVLVKEGDHVKAGQKLATLRSGSLGAAVASARANVQTALAALQALQEGVRPEEIAIAQAQVNNKKAALSAAKESLISSENALESLQKQKEIAVSGLVATTNSTISQQLSTAKTALQVLQGVYQQNEVVNNIIQVGSTAYSYFLTTLTQTLNTVTSQQSIGLHAQDYDSALMNLSSARSTVASASLVLNTGYDLMSTLPLNGYVTNTIRETHKATIAVQKTAIQSALATLDAAIKSLQDSAASYDTQIASAQGSKDRAKADINTYQTSLAIEEASLRLKMAPARQTDIDAAMARVHQAEAQLAQAAAQFNSTVLLAPVDGTISTVSIKQGEMRPATEPSIKMLGSTPLRIDMYVSDIDVPKVQTSQSGSIKLDAYQSTPFALRVGYVDTAPTSKDGVDKYRIKLDFVYPHPELKIGMTGDVTIVTGQRHHVVKIPSRAIIEDDNGDAVVRILQKNGDVLLKSVVVGMEGENGDTEIVSGIGSGATVVTLIKK